MAVAQGYGKTVTSGSVFAYDTGDTRNSYIGEPTTNVFTHYGTEGEGSGADNAVNFTIQGTTGFTRLGYNQTFGDYTIKPGDVVYKYNLGGYGCHYHGNTATIPSGKYATFTFDYYVSPGTTVDTTLLANFENYGNSALGGNINAPNTLTGVWQTVTATFGPTGGSGTQAMFLYPGGCGTRFGDTGYILYKNPQVEFLPHKTPFVQTTRSATQGLLPLVGNSSLDLTNVSFDSNAQMTFDGTNDYISLPTNVIPTNEITIEFVCTKTNLEANNSIIAGGAGGNQDLSVHLPWGDGNVYWDCGRPFNRINKATTLAERSGVHHWVFTKNPSTGVMNIYLDGNLWHTGGGLTSTMPSLSSVSLGRYDNGGFTGYYYPGNIPVAKIYNRELSAGEVRQNYLHYKTRFNLS